MSNSIDSRGISVTPGHGGPLSYIQESLWLADKASRQDGPAYNEPIAFRVTGKLRVDVLRQALHRIVARHEALRTVFVETADGLRAVVQETIADFVEVADLRGLETQDAKLRANELITDSYSRPFDLGSGPLLRAIVVVLAADETIIGLTVHHIAIDAWSYAIILDEISQNYISLLKSGQPTDLPEPTVKYADYVLKLRRDFERGIFTTKIQYWREILNNGPEVLRLPLDHPRPPRRTFTGSTCSLNVPKAYIAAPLDLCRRSYRCTDFTLLLSAYAVLLNRYTGQDTLTIGTTLLNRSSSDLLNVVGCFVNTAALVLDLDDDMTFRELLAHVTDVSHKMLNNGDAPYPKVLERLDIQHDPSHPPVCQTVFTFLGQRPMLNLGQGTTCTPFPIRRVAAKFETLFYISEYGDDIEFEIEYNTDLFNTDTIERMLRHYVHLLQQLEANIDTKISSLSILPDDERSLILDTWNDTGVDYPSSTVIAMFEAQAEKTPEAIAVEFDDDSLTYDELNRLANQVARFLIEKQRTDFAPFIGVYMERSLEMVVALLAVVKAGFAYLPVDPEYPADRIQFMIEDAQLSLILTQNHHRADLAGGGADVIVLSAVEPRAEDDTNVNRNLSPDSPVYMIYTSGSTGRPKGVVNRHVSLFNRLYWMQSEYGLTTDDRILQKTPFSFDVSVWEFFWPLMFGARIVVAKPGGHRDGDYLKRVIHDREITTIHFVPSMLSVFLEEDDLKFFCGSLRRVICSGEALPYKTVKKFYAHLGCGLHNLYGPTEAAIDVSYWPCSLDYPGQVVPIGKPIANLQLYILDKHMQLQPIGAPGELCIGGIGLAVGYHNRDDLTRKAFVANPFSRDPDARLYRTGDLARFLPDGQIQYLGRIDNQIKLRGFRIELEEINAVLRSMPNLKEAIVVLHETATSQMLVGYVVASEFDEQDIKDQLKKRLPEFMIPQLIIEISSIPTTANGKLDRRALPDPFTDARFDDQVTAPSSPEEELLVEIWTEVLGLNRAGIDANFFQYGGDSIHSIRVAARLRELGYAVEVQDVFARPTIRGLAELMRSRQTSLTGPVETPLCLISPADREMLGANVKDAWPLTMLQLGMIYHTMLHENTSVYHDIFDYDIVASVHPEYVHEAVRLIVAHHPELGSMFDLDGFSVPLQIVHSQVVVPVEIVDVTHLPRDEQDKTVERWIAAEKRRPLDVTHGPLLRLRIHVRSRDSMSLAISFHHALLDGWSIALLIDEFVRVYADLLQHRLPEFDQEHMPHSTYVNLELQAVQDPSHAMFWSDTLRGFAVSALSSSKDRDTAGLPGAPASADRTVAPPLAQALRTFAGESGVPLKTVYLALHVSVLGQVLEQRQVVSGVVVNGRPEVPGGEKILGLFLNTLPFPFEVRDEGWPELVERVFEIEQSAVAYRRFPLAEIQRMTGTRKWFDTVFNYTDFHVYKGSSSGGVRIVGARYFEHTNFDVVVHVHRDYFSDAMRLIVNYDPSRVAATLIERYLDEYLIAAADLTSCVATARPSNSEAGAIPATSGVQTTGLKRAAYIAPHTALERQITDIISDAIGIESLGADDNYLELGVDSITAIRIISKIKKLKLGLTMKDVFVHPTVRKLASRAETERDARSVVMRPVRPFELAGRQERSFPRSVVDAYPATSMQLHMIRATEHDVAQAAYHDVFSYSLVAPLDEALLRACLNRIMNGHDVFRTAFSLDGYSVPMQLVYATVQPRVEVFDLSFLPGDQQEMSFTEWFEREKQTAFNWTEPGLIRFFAHRRSSVEFILTLSFHHSIIDGWSLSLFIRDLVEVYVASLNQNTEPSLTFPALKYRDYVRTELEGQKSRVLRDFWWEKLHGHTYNSFARPDPEGPTRRWSETRVVLNEKRQEALSMLSAQLGVPLKYMMLACHVRVLSLIRQEFDVVTGVVASGRLEEDEGERVLGLFLNFVPFRQRIGDQTWRGLIHETFDNDRWSLPYRRYPLGNIEQDLGQKPIFETLFNYTQFKAYSDIAFGVNRTGIVRDTRWFEHVGVPLLTNVGHDVRQERLIITLNADGSVFPQQPVELIGKLYVAVLAQLVEQVDEAVTNVSSDVADLVSALGG